VSTETTQLVGRDAAVISDAERTACDALWTRIWPPNPDEPHEHDPEFVETRIAYTMLLRDDGSLLGACVLEEREITVNGEPYRIAALGGVVVEEAHRQRGYGSRMVRAWMDDARARGYGFGVLWTGERRVGFYERLGWVLLEGDLSYRWLGEERRIDGPILATAFTPDAKQTLPVWRTARVHLGVGSW
jgi:GNAT superfamily N-acetyltransferase